MAISTHRTVLIRMLRHFDQTIAKTERRLLQPLSAEDLHKAIEQVADLNILRARVEDELRNSRGWLKR
jgi:hypothetical protein